MRIFYIYRAIAYYRGMERILVDKMNALATFYGYDVTLITADQGNHPFTYRLHQNVQHIDLSIRFHQALRYNALARPFMKILLQYRFVSRLKKCIRDMAPDVLICNTDVFPNLVIMAKGQIPLIVESHNICRETLRSVESLRWTILRKFTLWNLRRANVIVALTEGDANEWLRYNSRVRVISNIVHQNDTGLVSDVKSKHVIFASRFAKQKGIPYLIEIWKRVHSQFPEWTLDIYAEGELQSTFQPQLEALEANVVVHSPSSDIFQAYIQSSVFLLTSEYEPFGLVLPEAMSCGLPVVAFDCDFGPREIITSGEDGFLVPLYDVDAYVAAVCKLLGSYELRSQMGRNGVVSAQRYSASRIMPQWVKLFEEVSGVK